MFKIWIFDKHCPSWRCHIRMKSHLCWLILRPCSFPRPLSKRLGATKRPMWSLLNDKQLSQIAFLLFASACNDLVLSSMLSIALVVMLLAGRDMFKTSKVAISPEGKLGQRSKSWCLLGSMHIPWLSLFNRAKNLGLVNRQHRPLVGLMDCDQIFLHELQWCNQ